MSDGTVVIKSQQLSKKDELLRSKLFKKNQPSKEEKQEEHKKQLVYKIEGENNINGFLDDMKDEIKEMNSSKVTLGMLQTQTILMKQQQEILQQNYQALNNLTTQRQNNVQPINQQTDSEEQKKVLKHLLKPLKRQIKEIMKLQEEIKPTRSMQIDSSNKKEELKTLLNNTNQNLDFFLPQNLRVLENMSNMNIDAYASCINGLKKQINDLQKEAEIAEIEVEKRYKKLQEVPKHAEDLQMKQTMQNLLKNLETINFIGSRDETLQKLGGEFDYQKFQDEINEIIQDGTQIFEDYSTEISLNYNIIIPNIDKEEFQLLDVKVPSILDEIKQKYNIDLDNMPKLKPNVKYQNSPASYTQNQILNLKPSSIKPNSLKEIQSKPQFCPPQIEYSKTQSKYAQLWGDEQQKQPKLVQQVQEIQNQQKQIQKEYDQELINVMVSENMKDEIYKPNVIQKKQVKEQEIIEKDLPELQIDMKNQIKVQQQEPQENFEHENLIDKDKLFVQEQQRRIEIFENQPGNLYSLVKDQQQNSSTLNYDELVENAQKNNLYPIKQQKSSIEEFCTDQAKLKLIDVFKKISQEQSSSQFQPQQYESIQIKQPENIQLPSQVTVEAQAQKIVENFLQIMNNAMTNLNQTMMQNLISQQQSQQSQQLSNLVKSSSIQQPEQLNQFTKQNFYDPIKSLPQNFQVQYGYHPEIVDQKPQIITQQLPQYLQQTVPPVFLNQNFLLDFLKTDEQNTITEEQSNSQLTISENIWNVDNNNMSRSEGQISVPNIKYDLDSINYTRNPIILLKDKKDLQYTEDILKDISEQSQSDGEVVLNSSYKNIF